LWVSEIRYQAGHQPRRYFVVWSLPPARSEQSTALTDTKPNRSKDGKRLIGVAFQIVNNMLKGFSRLLQVTDAMEMERSLGLKGEAYKKSHRTFVDYAGDALSPGDELRLFGVRNLSFALSGRRESQ
jgi:hypothetical protein